MNPARLLLSSSQDRELDENEQMKAREYCYLEN